MLLLLDGRDITDNGSVRFARLPSREVEAESKRVDNLEEDEAVASIGGDDLGRFAPDKLPPSPT